MENLVHISTSYGRLGIEAALSQVPPSVRIVGSQETEDCLDLIVSGPPEYTTRLDLILNPSDLAARGNALFSEAAKSYLTRKSQSQSGHLIPLGGIQYIYHVKQFAYFIWKDAEFNDWYHYEVQLNRYPAGPFRTRLEVLEDIHKVGDK
jgi:hypothetical protein